VKADLRDVPRRFSPLEGIQLSDMGDIYLEDDEQLTFRTESGKGNDIVKKDWGFYLSNSVNSNLRKQGFKTALVVSFASGEPRVYVNLVEAEKLEEFHSYLTRFNARLMCWLDDWFDETIPRLEKADAPQPAGGSTPNGD